MEEIVNPATSFYKLNQDLDTLNEWPKQWIVTFNASKTEFLIISKKIWTSSISAIISK
jgi:hypothetical protein